MTNEIDKFANSEIAAHNEEQTVQDILPKADDVIDAIPEAEEITEAVADSVPEEKSAAPQTHAADGSTSEPKAPELTEELQQESDALATENAGTAFRKPGESDTSPAADGKQEVAADEVDSFGRRVKKPYHERAYLYYGRSAQESTLDISGTKEFLYGIGFDGGELRKARTGKDYAEAARQAGEKEETGMFCSYCGTPISGVDYYRLPDGRIRCTNCSRTIVKSVGELKEIYKKVLLNLEVFFGASITVPVEVEMLEERKLKKKLKMPLSDVDSKSILVLGVAVEDKKKQYSINLENGAPRLSVIATFAHELTHIWQYTHWNDPNVFKKLQPAARLLMYEGMAKWAEIQYLYLVGETAAAKREELVTRARQDEYGIGFLLYVNKYPLSKDNMPGSDTPFKTTGYPID